MSRGLGPLKVTFTKTYFELSSLRVNLSTRCVGAMVIDREDRGLKSRRVGCPKFLNSKKENLVRWKITLGLTWQVFVVYIVELGAWCWRKYVSVGPGSHRH